MLRLTAVLYWLVLVVWFAGIVAAAATAMASFGTLTTLVGDLGVTVPQFASSDPSGPDAGRYLAGFVAQKVFDTVGLIEWFTLPTMLLLLLVQWGSRWPERSVANALRVVALLAACGATAFFLLVVSPRMQTALNDYRGAMRGGDLASAATYKESFDADHRISDPIFRTTGFLLLGAILLSAATLTPRTLPDRR